MYDSIREFCRRYRVVLASGSPRRRSLLTEIGCEFSCESHEVDETRSDGEPPMAFATRLAKEKALAVSAPTQNYVFGFDTIVIIDDLVLGKPESPDEAAQMLRRLSGRTHQVCTAIAIAAAGRIIAAEYDISQVTFHSVTDEQIENYVRNGEPMDKAGAYGIQGMGAFLVDTVQGNLDTVIGLPRNLLDRMCAAAIEQNR